MDKEAEAVAEVAKTTGKAIDAGREFGGFVSRIVGRPLEIALGIFEDKLKYFRWERQLRLIDRAQKLLTERGLAQPTRQVPLGFAIPLLEAASLEEDDQLQDMWARLLVNAADANSQVEVRRTFITILENLAPLDALILERIAAEHTGERDQDIWTKYLPERVLLEKPEPEDENLHPPHDVEIALANLARLGCITSHMAWGGMAIFSCVNITALGQAFIKACASSSAGGDV